MTPSDLRAICELLTDEQGTGGQTRLAELLEWDASTIRRKLSGKSRIAYSDELAIRQAVAAFQCQPKANGSNDLNAK